MVNSLTVETKRKYWQCQQVQISSDVMWVEFTHKTAQWCVCFLFTRDHFCICIKTTQTHEHSQRMRLIVLWSTHLERSWTVGYGGSQLNMSGTHFFWFFFLNAFSLVPNYPEYNGFRKKILVILSRCYGRSPYSHLRLQCF